MTQEEMLLYKIEMLKKKRATLINYRELLQEQAKATILFYRKKMAEEAENGWFLKNNFSGTFFGLVFL